ncbi:hypothetical protein H9M94_00825 [Mycoplasma sp. Pen4]|uniref:hypothetical protein n=1 Tax=Mycoplasma sp. Pen4 TaxID=640330 RepID=UPI00165417E0|nr:hypothetical protein [Mycoplasma sp. Pen4]QNM93805.1 hypothetical protein H9M94_00825 [Mycoplasma sp. Pen4]
MKKTSTKNLIIIWLIVATFSLALQITAFSLIFTEYLKNPSWTTISSNLSLLTSFYGLTIAVFVLSVLITIRISKFKNQTPFILVLVGFGVPIVSFVGMIMALIDINRQEKARKEQMAQELKELETNKEAQ